jgi:hypothetical protein
VQRLAATTALGLLLAGLLAAPGAMAGTEGGSCPGISAGSVSKVFGLAHVAMHSPETPPPGNTAGVVATICRIVAWNGATPKGRRAVRQKLLSGQGAGIIVQAHKEETASEYAKEWREHGFEHTLSVIEVGHHRATKIFGGSNFDPPNFGADFARGWVAVKNRVKGATGLWWTTEPNDIWTVSIEVAKGKNGPALISEFGESVVPSFGIE